MAILRAMHIVKSLLSNQKAFFIEAKRHFLFTGIGASGIVPCVALRSSVALYWAFSRLLLVADAFSDRAGLAAYQLKCY